MSKKKKDYVVTHPSCSPFTVYGCSSPQNACRQAFKHWIKQGELKRQPKSDDCGGFKNVVLEIL